MRFVSVLLLLGITLTADAQFRRGGGWQPSTGPAYRAVPNTAVDAMADVNARRAAAGLKPFILDPELMEAAKNAASCRASILCTGHLQNDYAAGGPGYPASVSGCGVMQYGMFLSCGSEDRKTYAGAAKALGKDGRWYCHLFVRQ